MPSKKAVSAAPLLTGSLLAFESAGAIVQNGLSLWSVLGVVGGCAAIIIGFGILLEWDTFERDPTMSNQSSAALLAVATVAFLIGTAIAIA